MTSLLDRWRGPSLVLQILLLLLGGLVVAQIVTLLLTVLLPPAQGPQHSLAAVAAALNGVEPDDARPDRLERVVQAGPPDVARPGWLQSDRSRGALAGLLGVPDAEVRLAFFTPLPFAGSAPPRKVALANDGPSDVTTRLLFAQYTPPAGGMRPPPQTQLPRSGQTPVPRDGLPPGLRAGDARGDGFAIPRDVTAGRTRPALIEIDPRPSATGTYIPGDGGAAVPPLLQGAQSAVPPLLQGVPRGDRPLGGVPAPIDAARMPLVMVPPAAILPARPAVVPQTIAPAQPVTIAPPAPRLAPSSAAPAFAPPPPASPVPPPVALAPATPLEQIVAAEAAIPLRDRPRGLFGFAPAPFVEGDFVAALRLGDGRWAVVQPAPEPFPNAWQRRLLLWFLLAFAIVAPVGWLFARRVVKPLTGFAEAAERLGRDPAGIVEGLDGPAEVGRAARAFNLMQSRLKSFVEDRTAYVGAISHDLRTPLTRLRFRIEEVEDDRVRDGMIEEVEEMEAMIASVLAFIRDASSQSKRERLDLRTIVEDVAEDAQLIGGDVGVAGGAALPVEVDVLGIRRLLANLIDNAVKYGGRARVVLTVERGEAVAAVIDDGPGLPDEELERAFEPFYRSPSVRASTKVGHGLGLAVCRSIARAHGGDVRLRRLPAGFVAELRVPLAYDAERALAA